MRRLSVRKKAQCLKEGPLNPSTPEERSFKKLIVDHIESLFNLDSKEYTIVSIGARLKWGD